MPQYCTFCGAQMVDDAAFCSVCGKTQGGPAAATATPPASSGGGLSDNIAGLLAYITIIPAILFLVLEPYSRRPFVRFHAFQSILFVVACVVANIGVSILGVVPVLRWATLLLWPLLGLAEFVIWLLLLLKAGNGHMFKLPVIGDMAERQAGAWSGPGSAAKAA